MTFKTKVLNQFRRISKIRLIENILSKRIINGGQLSRKLIAGNSLYANGSWRSCMRDGIHYRLDISDYMEHSIYFGIQDGVDFDRRMLYSLIKEDSICVDIGA